MKQFMMFVFAVALGISTIGCCRTCSPRYTPEEAGQSQQAEPQQDGQK